LQGNTPFCISGESLLIEGGEKDLVLEKAGKNQMNHDDE
jgi:hypothetical protein